MKEIFGSLDKIRWHDRPEKLASLHKLLKYKFSSREVTNFFDAFLKFDKIINDFHSEYLFGKTLPDNMKDTVGGISVSFSELTQVDSDILSITLYVDKPLQIIKCSFLQSNHQKVVEMSKQVNFKNLYDGSISNCLSIHPKSSWKLLAEALVCYAQSVDFLLSQDSKSFDISPPEIFSSICLSIEIIYNLIKFQETVLCKKVKTSPRLYGSLVYLLFLCIKLFIEMSMKYGTLLDRLYRHVFSIISIVKSMEIQTYDTDSVYLRPFYYTWISLELLNWFTFKKESTTEDSPPFSFGFIIPKTTQSLPNIHYFAGGKNMSLVFDHANSILNHLGSKLEAGISKSGSYNRRITEMQVRLMVDLVAIISQQTYQSTFGSVSMLRNLALFFENSSYYSHLALTLYSSKHYIYSKATSVYTLTFDSTNIYAISLLIHLLINNFYDYREVLKLTNNIKEKYSLPQQLFYARAYAHVEQSFETISAMEARTLLNFAKSDIVKALEYDDNDHEIYFLAGLIFALIDDLDQALTYVAESIKRSLFDSRPYILVFSILVSKGVYSDATKFMNEALKEFSNDFSLLYSKALFEYEYYGPDIAIKTIKSALELWYSLFDEYKMNSDVNKKLKPRTSSISKPTQGTSTSSEPHSTTSFSLNEPPRGSVQTCTDSSIPNNLKKKESILFSSSSDFKDPLYLVLLLYVKMGEFALEMENLSLVTSCIERINSLGCVSPDIFLLQARAFAAEGLFDKALSFYESALYLDPNHSPTLFSLSLFYFKLHENHLNSSKNSAGENMSNSKNLILAEETARKMIKVDPKNYNSWRCLGQILLASGEVQESTFCLSRAMELQNYYFIVPLKSIFRRYRPSDTIL